MWIYNKNQRNKEPFQSIKTRHGYRQVDWIPPIRERNEIDPTSSRLLFLPTSMHNNA